MVQNMSILICDCESDTLAFKSDYKMHTKFFIIILDIELETVKRYNFNCQL